MKTIIVAFFRDFVQENGTSFSRLSNSGGTRPNYDYIGLFFKLLPFMEVYLFTLEYKHIFSRRDYLSNESYWSECRNAKKRQARPVVSRSKHIA